MTGLLRRGAFAAGLVVYAAGCLAFWLIQRNAYGWMSGVAPGSDGAVDANEGAKTMLTLGLMAVMVVTVLLARRSTATPWQRHAALGLALLAPVLWWGLYFAA